MAKKKTSKTVQARINSRKLREGLEQAEHLMSRSRWAEAVRLLRDLDRSHPQQAEILQALIETAVRLDDAHLYQYGCEALYRLRPQDPDLPYMLTLAYLKNGWAALALSMGTIALAQAPANERAGETRKLVEGLTPAINEQIRALGLSGPDGLECLCLHDQARSLLAQGRYAKAAQVAEKLALRRPRFPPAYNNGAEACFHDGQVAQAMALTKQLLAFDPDNVFALSNLIRFQCVFGKLEEARELAKRLKAIAPPTKDLAVKQAEAFTYLGDDAAVLEICEKGRRLPHGEGPQDEALLCHLAAVANYRQGREGVAQQCWKDALRALPQFEPARDNLDDLKQPIAARNAPWSFAMPYLVPRKLIERLATRVLAAKDDEDAVAGAAAEYFQSHPELDGLVPLLLDRSDRAGRELALRLAGLLRTPAMLQAARDFALGQRGSDQLRMRAAQIASEAGILPETAPKLWVQGEWREVHLLAFQISGEPIEHRHAPGVTDLIADAMTALRAREAADAERLLRQALAIDPDDPVVMNNLAQALKQLGRADEAEALTLRAHERHPDYLFARTALAGLATRRGQLDRAQQLLDPLLSRKRFHFAEFAALSATLIDLYLAQGKAEAAKHWLDMWRKTTPDHPALKDFERRVRRLG